jgi:hypothetical protein
MKAVLTIFLVAMSSMTFAQDKDASLKKDIMSAEIGLFTASLNYERHLGGLFTLKTGVGVGVYFGQDFFSGNTYWEFTPIVIAEPRYYYNFNRRVQRGRKTSYNASNYLALSVSYFSNPVVVSGMNYHIRQSAFSLIPEWGLKRTLGKRMNFEFAIGYGLTYTLHEFGTGVGLDLRFGYNIK